MQEIGGSLVIVLDQLLFFFFFSSVAKMLDYWSEGHELNARTPSLLRYYCWALEQGP